MPEYPFDKCKVCGLNRVTVCDCEFEDSTCPNNHQWYRCQLGKRHEGEYDEDVPCSCVGNDGHKKTFDVNELNFSSDDEKPIRNKPGHHQEKPDRHQDKPDRQQDKPDRHREKPDRHQDKPDRHREKPDRHREKPDRHREKPHHDREKPHHDREKPDLDSEKRVRSTRTQGLNVLSSRSSKHENGMSHMGLRKDKRDGKETKDTKHRTDKPVKSDKKDKNLMEFERQIQKQVRAQIKNQLKEQYKAEEEKCEDSSDKKHRKTKSHKS